MDWLSSGKPEAGFVRQYYSRPTIFGFVQTHVVLFMCNLHKLLKQGGKLQTCTIVMTLSCPGLTTPAGKENVLLTSATTLLLFVKL
jgi:hypothetical protein